jgi:secreted PhoX family phosphatase
MGIMNHENVVINNAGTVAYYGEDGGTHMVYKYVMDTPNDLSSGDLYVLKLDQGLNTAGDPAGTTAT